MNGFNFFNIIQVNVSNFPAKIIVMEGQIYHEPRSINVSRALPHRQYSD